MDRAETIEQLRAAHRTAVAFLATLIGGDAAALVTALSAAGFVVAEPGAPPPIGGLLGHWRLAGGDRASIGLRPSLDLLDDGSIRVTFARSDVHDAESWPIVVALEDGRWRVDATGRGPAHGVITSATITDERPPRLRLSPLASRLVRG